MHEPTASPRWRETCSTPVLGATRQRRGRLRFPRGLIVIAVALGVLAIPAYAFAAPRHSSAKVTHSARSHRSRRPGDRNPRLSPEVRYTGQGPTGYTVTFQYWDPSATSVQIKGEWYFSSPSQTTTTSSQGLLPSQWSPGDFPIPYPNATAANWPVTAMTKNSRTGVWSYTTPLPSGVFTYGFFVNCSSSTQTGCTEISDPSNPPWNDHNGVSTGSVEPTSQVYVPSDPRFHTVNYWWQASTYPRGALGDVTYPSPTHVSPAGQNYLAIYTPPGYDPGRAAQYPTLYLSHGGGGNEVDWATQGDLRNIMDNLIDTGQIEPMVVVMPNENGYLQSTDPANPFAPNDQDLINNIIPYVQSHYDVSPSASERAVAGPSMGGAIVNTLMLNDTGEFAYYGVMSPGQWNHPTSPYAIPPLTPAQITAMQQVTGIYLGGGWQDPIHSWASGEAATLVSGQIPLTPDFINGGHEWYVWRILLHDFLTRVAFQPVPG
jgi:enterochelin esterase-like enzyme